MERRRRRMVFFRRRRMQRSGGFGSKDPGAYWRKLKQRLKNEGSEVVTNCHGLKMQAADGKYYKTDCLDTKGVLRLVQSIPDVVRSYYLRVNGVLRCVGFTR